jgi:hypothetical protein
MIYAQHNQTETSIMVAHLHCVESKKGNVGILSSVDGPRTKLALLPTAKVIYGTMRCGRFVEVGGNVFIHVGEFKGLTGSTDFERYLQKKFQCVHRSLFNMGHRRLK